MTERPSTSTSQTLDRGIRLLEILAQPDHEAGLTVSALAGQLGTGRTIVYRLLATLEPHGLISRSLDGRVRLGLGLTRLTAALEPRLRTAALPALRKLADEAGATAHLTVVEGGQAVAIAVVEPTWTQYHVAYRVGSRHPLERGAAGRAILRAREGRPGPVTSSGELQAGAHGTSPPLSAVAGLEGSVVVISLQRLDRARVEPLVLEAVAAVTAALS